VGNGELRSSHSSDYQTALAASAVQGALEESFLEVAARSIEDPGLTDSVLWAIVRILFRAMPPLHTEKGLAARADLRPAEVSRLSKALYERTGCTLLDLLHLVALFRVSHVLARTRARVVKMALQQLHLSRSTAQRASRRLFDLPLATLAQRPDLVQDALREFVIRLRSGNSAGPGRQD
jgi:hypothetical protein